MKLMVIEVSEQPAVQLATAPSDLVEDVDTKSIRVPVVNPPLPERMPAPRVDAHEVVIPRRPNLFRRLFPLPPTKPRRVPR